MVAAIESSQAKSKDATKRWRLVVGVCRSHGTRVARWTLAYGCVFPVRYGIGALIVLWVFYKVDLAYASLVSVVTVAGLKWLSSRILRRSRRDPLSLTPLVKSLQLRRRVKKRWERGMHEVGLSKSHGQLHSYPRHRRIDITPMGVRTLVHVGAVAATTEQLRSKKLNLESKFAACGSRVMPIGSSMASFELRHTDPLSHVIRTWELPKPTKRNHVVVGKDEDGYGVQKELRLPSVIIGAQGSGKSTEVWATIHALIHTRVPFRLRIFDPKGGLEFDKLADVAYQYERNPLKWEEFLGRTLGAMAKRQQALAGRGLRNLTTYTWDNPLDLMVIDELLTLAAFADRNVTYFDRDGKHTLKAGNAFMLFMSQARAAGFSLLALTQLGQKAILGPQVMDLFGYRTCQRVASDDLVDIALGVPGASKQYPAHLLPQDERQAGKGYVDTRTPRGIVQYRGASLTEQQEAGVISDLRRIKPRLMRSGGEES